jgi:hypothetical protein
MALHTMTPVVFGVVEARAKPQQPYRFPACEVVDVS